MSSEKKHGPLQVKRLEGEALDWVERALATGIKYKYVVTAFLETFPEYDAEHQSLSEEEIRETFTKRFKRMRGDTRRKSYHRIKVNEVIFNSFLDVIPIASPINRLIELEILRQHLNCRNLNPESTENVELFLKNVNLFLKVLNAAAREQYLLEPRERGVTLPRLPDPPIYGKQITSDETDSDETETGPP